MNTKSSSITGHLKELRTRLLKSVIFLFIAFVITIPTFGIMQKDTFKSETISTNETRSINFVDENNLITNIKEGCEAPEWAIKIGHEEQWKLHNGCK